MTEAIDQNTIHIDKLVYGGDGLGRLSSGEVVFVPWSAPGDELSIWLKREQKPLKASIEQIITPSPNRVEAPCSVFGTCGGCQWQQLSPQEQRIWKHNIVQESLERIGKIQNPYVNETFGSDASVWHYRNRTQWVVEPIENSLKLGYQQSDSHTVVEFDHCWIIPQPMTPLAHWLKANLPTKSTNFLKRIEIQQNEKGEWLITLEAFQKPPVKPDTEQAAASFIKSLTMMATQCVQTFPNIQGVVLRDKQGIKKLVGEDHLIYTLADNLYRVSAGSFFQINTQAAEQMLAVLSQWFSEEVESLLDVYAGVGTFAIHFKDKARRIMAIESSKQAIADAKENVRLNRAPQIEIHAGDARQIFKTLKTKFDAAILDPPRAGCHTDVLNWLSTHITKKLFYISCNPTTLARDLHHLQNQGWQIQTIQPVDMFPQTYHIETLIYLKKQ